MRLPGALRAGLLLAAVVAAVYGPALRNPFHYDDYHSILQNPHVRSLAEVPRYFADPAMFSVMPGRGMYRPVLLLSYALNYAAGGYQARGYHLVDLLLHVGSSLLVWALARRLGAGSLAAAGGAVVFAVHPLTSEVTNYISCRSESLAATLFLGAVLLYLRWRTTGSTAAWLGSWLAGAAAVLTKSTAAVLPVTVLWYEVQAGARPLVPRRVWAWHAAYWAVLLAYLVAARTWLVASAAAAPRPLGEQLWTQAKAMAFYIHWVAMPVHLSVEHTFWPSLAPWSPSVAAALAALASLAWFSCRSRGRAALVLGWALLPLLPASLVPLNVLVSEHRLYLPLAFLCCGAALAAHEVPRAPAARRTWVSWGVVFAVLLALGARQRTGVWHSELSLWEDAARRAPRMYRTWLQLGGAQESAGQMVDAVASYRRAMALDPTAVEVPYNLGNALLGSGAPEAAKVAYERCLALNPSFAPALLNLSSLYLDQQNPEAAAPPLEHLVAIEPQMPEAWRQLGVLRRQQGRVADAEACLQRALSLRPGFAEAHLSLGSLCRDTGRVDEAVEHFRAAVAAAPYYVKAYCYLAEACLLRGDRAGAIQCLQDGLGLVPGDPYMSLELARAQELAGDLQAAAATCRALRQQAALSPQDADSLDHYIRRLERGGASVR